MSVCRKPVKTKLLVDLAREDDTGYASDKAIIALHHAATSLPLLQRLTLVDTPVHPKDIGLLGSALMAFAVSLTHLSMDTWISHRPNFQTSTGSDGVQLQKVNTETTQKILFSAISRLLKLQTLSIRNWVCLVGDEFQEAGSLQKLAHLEQVFVHPFPCVEGSCVLRDEDEEFCRHFPPGPPFTLHSAL